MATQSLVSVDEYLHSSYHPDCDYVDGAILERNLGQFEHSRLQMLVLIALNAHAAEWGVLVLPELRLKIGPRKYRIPDVMVLAEDAPRTPVIEQPPLLCIEIVSPDDRIKDLTERARDYVALGVPETWILDPAEKQAYVYSAAGLHQVASGVSRLVLGEISLEFGQLFLRM